MKRKTTEQYSNEVKVKRNGEYKLLGVYVNRDTETEYMHNVEGCKARFILTPKNFDKYKYPCPKCRKMLKHKNNIKSDEQFKQEVKDLYGEEYSVTSKYDGNKSKVEIRHNRKACNYNTFVTTPNNFLRGHTCPECNKSTVSFIEMCIFLAIKNILPDLHKEKINGLECDMVTNLVSSKAIGIQYDGFYFHKNAKKDNNFNEMFLTDKDSDILIRVREKGCPKLKNMNNLYIIETPPKYTKENIQNILNDIIRILNDKYDKKYSIILTEEVFNEARTKSTRAYTYKKLVEEYIDFVEKNDRTPNEEEQNNLRRRINAALRKNKLDEIDEKKIISIRNEYNDIKIYRSTDEIFEDLIKFILNNGFIPRQASKGNEKQLYNEYVRCNNNNLFTEKQKEELCTMKRNSLNYVKTEEELLKELNDFIVKHKRFPSDSKNSTDEEKSLYSRINHRIARKSISNESIQYIYKLKEYYSIYQCCKREYISFTLNNNGLPYGKISSSILRYMRDNRYNEDDMVNIMECRIKYKSINIIIKEYNEFFNDKKGNILYKQFAKYIDSYGNILIDLNNNSEKKFLEKIYEFILKANELGWFNKEQKKDIEIRYTTSIKQYDKIEEIFCEFDKFISENNRLPSKNKANEQELRKKIDHIIKKYKNNIYIDISEFISLYKSNSKSTKKNTKKSNQYNTYDEVNEFYRINGRMPRHIRKKKNETKEEEYERKLAHRLTQLLYKDTLSEDKKQEIRSKLFINKDRPQIVLKELIDFYKNNKRPPKRSNSTEEKKILDNIYTHIKAEHYSEEEINTIYQILPNLNKK